METGGGVAGCMEVVSTGGAAVTGGGVLSGACAGAFTITGGGVLSWVCAGGVAGAEDVSGVTGATAGGAELSGAAGLTGGGVLGAVSGAGAGAAGVVPFGWSNSPIFSINAARAAACAALSSARTEIRPREITPKPTTGNNLEICIAISYAKSSPEATAFPWKSNCFCHAPGKG
jgi:hypothetical protein